MKLCAFALVFISSDLFLHFLSISLSLLSLLQHLIAWYPSSWWRVSCGKPLLVLTIDVEGGRRLKNPCTMTPLTPTLRFSGIACELVSGLVVYTTIWKLEFGSPFFRLRICDPWNTWMNQNYRPLPAHDQATGIHRLCVPNRLRLQDKPELDVRGD